MTNQILKSAIWYAKYGLSVIPVLPAKADANGKDEQKRPPIPWTPYQTRQATEDEIKQWFTDKPDARLGIVTGKLSNLTVLDCDTKEALEQVEKLLPDSFQVPIAVSPRGGRHYYFRHEPQISNKANIGQGLDARSEGGYIIAPPSSGLNGKGYAWLEGCRLGEVEISFIPSSLLSYILSLIRARIANNVPTVGTSLLTFTEPGRDDTLFHIANCLTKGGMPQQETQQLLELIGSRVCDPPFPQKEISEKVKSAIKRQDATEKNLTEEVREWVCRQGGVFLSSEIVKELELSSRVAKKNLSKILSRFAEDGIIEKSGNKRGSWRLIDRKIQEQCWWQDDGLPLSLRFPLGIENFAKVFPGNVILLEGQKSQGKSAFALEFCRLNAGSFGQKALYQNVEMSNSELLERFKSYGDVMTPEQWRTSVIFIRQTTEWWDKILPDGLNVVDYLIEYEKSYMIADFVWKIHQKLKNGIALIVVQRNPLKPYPWGGQAVRDIPRLILSLVHHKLKLEDIKTFHPTAYGNPSGLVRKYKQVNWWQFKPDSEWEQDYDEKYKDFK